MSETENWVAAVAHFTAVTDIAPTQREPGCIGYELNQEIENPRNFTFAARFASPADFEAHESMPYVKGLHRRILP